MNWISPIPVWFESMNSNRLSARVLRCGGAHFSSRSSFFSGLAASHPHLSPYSMRKPLRWTGSFLLEQTSDYGFEQEIPDVYEVSLSDGYEVQRLDGYEQAFTPGFEHGSLMESKCGCLVDTK